MTELQLQPWDSQMARLDDFVARRHEIFFIIILLVYNFKISISFSKISIYIIREFYSSLHGLSADNLQAIIKTIKIDRWHLSPFITDDQEIANLPVKIFL